MRGKCSARIGRFLYHDCILQGTMISLVRCTIQTVKDAASRSSEAASSTCKRTVKHGIRCCFFSMFVFQGLAQSLYRCYKDPPHNCAQPRHIIPADPNFEKKRNSSALFAREINLVTQPSFDCEQGINSQVQTACSNADAIFPVLGIVFCKNERFSLLRKTHVPLWNEPRISHVRLP